MELLHFALEPGGYHVMLPQPGTMPRLPIFSAEGGCVGREAVARPGRPAVGLVAQDQAVTESMGPITDHDFEQFFVRGVVRQEVAEVHLVERRGRPCRRGRHDQRRLQQSYAVEDPTRGR